MLASDIFVETRALVGAARALADDNPPQAVAFANRALAVNPSSVDAQSQMPAPRVQCTIASSIDR